MQRLRGHYTHPIRKANTRRDHEAEARAEGTPRAEASRPYDQPNPADHGAPARGKVVGGRATWS